MRSGDDTIGDLKKLVAAQTGTRHDKIVLKKWYTVFKDHITLDDYEIHDVRPPQRVRLRLWRRDDADGAASRNRVS